MTGQEKELVGCLLLVALLLGAFAGTIFSGEAGALDRFCTHQDPGLGYNGWGSGVQIGFTEGGSLKINCTSGDGRAEVYVLDVNKSEQGDSQ